MNNMFAVVGTAAETPSGGEGEGSSLAFTGSTYVFSILNIIVLFILLKLILFKPISKMMSDRTEKIKKNITDAENNKVETEKIKTEHQQQLEKLKDETNTIINNAHQKAQAEAEEIIKKAKHEAELLLAKSREQGEAEVQKALENVKDQVANLALLAASKVIQKNMDNEANRKLVEEFINEVGAA
jgi:F-type H+-transporting ATPase subunit b